MITRFFPFLLAASLACNQGETTPSGASAGAGGAVPCGLTDAPGAPFSRILPSFEAADPTTSRLCQEGSTPPDQLDNPWDLHCDMAAGRGASIDESSPPPRALRIVTWNIRFGTDLPGILALLGADPILSAADVLLLVEVDRGCNRSGKIDVARTIAAEFGMDWLFGVEFIEHAQGGCEEGNAILSRHPLGNPAHGFHNVGKVSRGALRAPYDWSLDPGEPRSGRRSFVSADVRLGDGLLRLTSAHLENRSDPRDRADAIGEILSLVDGIPRTMACVAGDFNVFPDIGTAVIDAPLFERFSQRCFLNPHADMPQTERRTRPSLGYQIDFAYLRALSVKDRGVLNQLPSVPSDHYPVWVDVVAP